jgi:hypothetical protein
MVALRRIGSRSGGSADPLRITRWWCILHVA